MTSTVSNDQGTVNIGRSTQSQSGVIEHYIGPMTALCCHCNAKHFDAEKVIHKLNSFNDCCSHGEVSLNPLASPPSFLKELYDGVHEKSNHFFERIRYYNNSFSFASSNVNLANFNSRRPGPYCFKIHGQIYYQINTSLYPATDDDSPSYGQLFFIDSNESINIRCQKNSALDPDIMRDIDSFMRDNNLFAKSYAMMKDELESMKALNNNEEPELQLLFTLKPGMDRGRYNFQRTNEVTAIFSTSADGDIPESFVTIRNTSTKNLQFVSTMSPEVEPWTYPLFYIHGTLGWNKDMFCVNGKRRVIRNAYIKYLMAIRDHFNIFIMRRRLFQQWVVDNYVKIEKDRISYCKFNQKKLRADSYQGLIDHLEKKANHTGGRVGKLVILPSTFISSPRHMLQLYQDAMAIVRKYGKPDLFITMTCNPKWHEIEENLLPGQTASDRPDIVARVFSIKKGQLIHYIVDKNIFGKVQAYVYVIEYQKRGLPHIHLLLILNRDSKITTPEVVDRYISAEVPDPIEHPILHEIVMRNMIHGPCGDWCLENGKCTKRYPRELCEETTMDENGYPHYRRRNTRKTYSRTATYMIDNRYVVPYNEFLLLSLNCHINTELVASIKAVKYLMKYVHKGNSAARVNVFEPSSSIADEVVEHDEIRDYLDARYVGPVEACWRILNKPLQKKSHSVLRLPVHLPHQHCLTIEDGGDDDAVRSALEKGTMLIDYFALNERDPDARQYLYPEIPYYYVFKKDSKGSSVSHWVKHQAHFNVIGRMYSVSPVQTELFHLRLLLINVKGARSFEDLKTVNGTIHSTYVATCLARGLIGDDDEWKRAMQEAELSMMPRQLRRLFVRILIYCQPVHPEQLWDEFKEAMSQDFSRHLRIDEAVKKCYMQINTMLLREGSSLESFPTMPQITEVDFNHQDMTQQEHVLHGRHQFNMLNEKQKEIVNRIINSVIDIPDEHSITCYYIDGPSGSGKTFTYTTVYHLLKGKGKKICTMAFTGIAATLLPEGKTVHKTFAMPVPLFYDSTSISKNQSKESEYLKNIDVFIWDEAPMAPRYALELIDRTLKDIMDNDLPFGGKIMILGGDFRQLLPVQLHATRTELVDLSIKRSSVWKYFQKFTLTQNMRALPEEANFAKFLLALGDGILIDNKNNIIMPMSCIASKDADIVEEIYGEIIREKRFEDLSKSAILTARNIDVEDINNRVVQLLDLSTEQIYNSVDSVENCDNSEINDAILPEYLNTLNPATIPLHELRLRKNCVVMLIRNLSISEGLCNGTRLIIQEPNNHILKCEILTGDKKGEISIYKSYYSLL